MSTQSKIGTVREIGQESRAQGRAASYALWTVQALLTALFLFAGSAKLVMPIEAMTKQMPLPGLFLRFIGVSEVLGAIGLVLPGILRIRRELTPLAASGLAIIMVGATAVNIATHNVGAALITFVAGILLLIVARGRWSSLKASSSNRSGN